MLGCIPFQIEIARLIISDWDYNTCFDMDWHEYLCIQKSRQIVTFYLQAANWYYFFLFCCFTMSQLPFVPFSYCGFSCISSLHRFRMDLCRWWECSDWDPPNFQIHHQIGEVSEVRPAKKAGSTSHYRQLDECEADAN